MTRSKVVAFIVAICALALAVWGISYVGRRVPLVISKVEPPTAGELRHVLGELPSGYLDTLTGTDEYKAKTLGLKVVAFDYTGGPLQCWLETSESGQSTFPARRPSASPAVTFAGGDVPTGRILFWISARVAPDMPGDLASSRRDDPNIPNYVVGLDINGQAIDRERFDPGLNKPVAPLWFGWSRAQISERDVSSPESQKSESSTIWELSATENIDGNDGGKRNVVMRLNARQAH